MRGGKEELLLITHYNGEKVNYLDLEISGHVYKRFRERVKDDDFLSDMIIERIVRRELHDSNCTLLRKDNAIEVVCQDYRFLIRGRKIVTMYVKYN